LSQTIADVLSTVPLSETTLADKASTIPAMSIARTYTGIVALTGAQLSDFCVLLEVACNRGSFGWTDPTDGIEKLVTFMALPEVIMKPSLPILPRSLIAVRLDLLYDKERAAAQMKQFDTHDDH
jgi:hypothetical protein